MIGPRRIAKRKAELAKRADPFPDLRAQCDRYLQERHCTLWGESFEIISPKGRAEAAEWLAKQIAGVAGLPAKDSS